MKPIKLEYSTPLIKKAIRAYWKQQVGIIFPLVTIAMASYLIFLIQSGDRSWLIGLTGTVTFIAITLMIALYRVHLNRSKTKLSAMGKPEATLELEEHRFRVSSGAGSSEIEWSMISKIWRYDEFWILQFHPGEFMTLPIKHFNQEDKTFILSRLQQANVKISDE